MTGSSLEVRNITKVFAQGKEKVTALSSVSISVASGEFVSLIGPSGCGKSTLLDLVSGLCAPEEGQIILDRQDITGTRGHVSYMPQSDVLFPWRTIMDNVIIPLQLAGISKVEAREEALALLPIFGLDKFAHYYPYMLSGGMKQRASFLRTYLCKKKLMLLDEPFGKLDALTKRQVQAWFLEMWERLRPSVLFVTHDVDEAILLSDRIFLLSPRPGTVVAEIKVNLPRPRPPKIITDGAFVAIKEEVLSRLETASNL